MQKYTSAASVWGASEMPVEPGDGLAAKTSSPPCLAEAQMEDSFTMVTISLASAGRTFFTACGNFHQTSLPFGEAQRTGGLRLSLIHEAEYPARKISAT